MELSHIMFVNVHQCGMLLWYPSADTEVRGSVRQFTESSCIAYLILSHAISARCLTAPGQFDQLPCTTLGDCRWQALQLPHLAAKRRNWLYFESRQLYMEKNTMHKDLILLQYLCTGNCHVLGAHMEGSAVGRLDAQSVDYLQHDED